MSIGSDHLFARWSRRKQAVRSSESRARDKEEHTDRAAAANVDAGPRDQQSAAAKPEAGETETADRAQILPRIEDLTPESNLSEFLREGVPEALKSAAIRKMWSLDPGIRDYVGPAEYAWDFNQPGSMPGFGSLDPEKAVVGFLSRIGRGMQPYAEETLAAAEASPEQPTGPSSEQETGASPDGTPDVAPPNESVEPRPIPASLPSPAPDVSEVTAGHAERSEPDQLPPIATRPRHGGAIPR